MLNTEWPGASAWPAATASGTPHYGCYVHQSPISASGGSPGDELAASAAAAEAEARKERVREKNRRAQGKYREKKNAAKQLAGAGLEAMAADLERLRLENERLAVSNQMLENVLGVREESVATLQQGQVSLA